MYYRLLVKCILLRSNKKVHTWNWIDFWWFIVLPDFLKKVTFSAGEKCFFFFFGTFNEPIKGSLSILCSVARWCTSRRFCWVLNVIFVVWGQDVWQVASKERFSFIAFISTPMSLWLRNSLYVNNLRRWNDIPKPAILILWHAIWKKNWPGLQKDSYLQ